MRKAAYFMSHPNQFGRPFDDGVMRALLAAGWEIDAYDPGGDQVQTVYPSELVHRHAIEYRARWLAREGLSGRWRKYGLFIGNCDLPMAFAGLLSLRAQRPCVTACDEIYSAGYVGPATRYWKTLSRYGMRRSRFTVITDKARISLQREYAGLSERHPFHQYPSCYPLPVDGLDRESTREALGISPNEFVIELTGQIASVTGADWIISLIPRLPQDYRILIRTSEVADPLVDALFRQLEQNGRIRFDVGRLDWEDAIRRAAAGDVGIVIYRQKLAQFQKMGVSSTKLCTHLALGQPVIATEQESFRFIEKYGCGVLIRNQAEILPALECVRHNYGQMSANAKRAVKEHIRPAERLSELTDVFRSIQ